MNCSFSKRKVFLPPAVFEYCQVRSGEQWITAVQPVSGQSVNPVPGPVSGCSGLSSDWSVAELVCCQSGRWSVCSLAGPPAGRLWGRPARPAAGRPLGRPPSLHGPRSPNTPKHKGRGGHHNPQLLNPHPERTPPQTKHPKHTGRAGPNQTDLQAQEPGPDDTTENKQALNSREEQLLG